MEPATTTSQVGEDGCKSRVKGGGGKVEEVREGTAAPHR